MTSVTIHPLGLRHSQWGEGPVWWQDRLLYVDIEGHAIVSLDCNTGSEAIYALAERVGMVVPAADGCWIFAGDSGIVHYDPQSGHRHLLADPEAAKRPHNRFNDGKCDPQGRLWAGTISTVKKTGDAALYRFSADGGCRQMVSDLTNSNGLCWSPCGQIFYHIDTPTRKVLAYPFDPIRGDLGKGVVVIDVDTLGLEGSPDGMTIDTGGKLWIVLCHGGAVFCCEPETGQLIDKINIPAIETTSCCFGGQDLDRLFITTGIPAKDKAAGANDGRVFVVDGLGVKGFAAVPFARA